MYSTVKCAKTIQQMSTCNAYMCVYQGEIETHREEEFVSKVSVLRRFVCMLSVLRRSVCICAIAKHHSCGLVKDTPMASAALQKSTHK